MSADGELQLLARVRELTSDLSDLAAEVTGILAGARRAGLDPEALGGLVGAAYALGASELTVYAVGRAGGPAYPDETTFIAHVTDAEDEIAGLLHQAGKLGQQITAAADAATEDLRKARLALAAAYAMPVKTECDGCHGARAAAIQAAQEAIADASERISICESAAELVTEIARRLKYALRRLQAVPSDLGETYESVYNLQRRGGVMPYAGRWIEGTAAG